VILADEPTGNLDDASAQLVIGEMNRQARSDRVVIIATHDPRVIERCDRTVEL